jgi:hypothetical protein
VTDAGERLERFGRDRVEPLRGIAEPLGQWPAQLEVELAVRIAGDGPVHVADVAADLVEVDWRVRGGGHRATLARAPSRNLP